MKKILTGIKPTAEQIHLGNYFGAIKQLLDFQKSGDYKIIAFVANMHALTTMTDGKQIKENTYNIIRAYLACGLDPEKVLLFKHSDVPAHAQLTRVLDCITNMGFMKRMHAYKDAINKGNEENTTIGTFSYPILMATDIILYDTDLVPVGKDQKQHVEYARDIANKFNKTFGETFKLPQPYIPEKLATIPGIDGRKMSKSYNNFIGLFEDEKVILKKVKSILTNAIGIDEPKNPDECNIYNILKLFLNEEEDLNIRSKYEAGGLSYKDVKMYLYEKIINFVKPIQEKLNNISDKQIDEILKKGAIKANNMAKSKIDDVYQKVGF